MAYADAEYYTDTFGGDVLPDGSEDKYLLLACDELDALTFGRLTFAFPTVEAHAEKVKRAVCAIAEALYYIDAARKANAAILQADGVTYRGAIASISSGRESISYSLGGSSNSAYSAAAASVEAQDGLIRSIAAKYLANIPDANGVNLLYAGDLRHVW